MPNGFLKQQDNSSSYQKCVEGSRFLPYLSTFARVCHCICSHPSGCVMSDNIAHVISLTNEAEHFDICLLTPISTLWRGVYVMDSYRDKFMLP